MTHTHILVVSHDNGLVQLIQQVCAASESPVQCHAVPSAVLARRFLAQEGEFERKPTPALMLVDYRLSNRAVEEIVSLVKRESELRTIPVVVLNGPDDSAEIQRLYELQANSVLPATPDEQSLRVQIAKAASHWLGVVHLPHSSANTRRHVGNGNGHTHLPH